MDPTKIGLFDLAEKRLVWTAQRQSVLAANIANANTPRFQAREVKSRGNGSNWSYVPRLGSAESTRARRQYGRTRSTVDETGRYRSDPIAGDQYLEEIYGDVQYGSWQVELASGQ